MSDRIKAALQAAKYRSEARQKENDDRRAEREMERRHTEAERNQFLRHCRIAEPGDYAEWLAGYLINGGAITHDYSSNFDVASYFDGSPARASWYVLTQRPNTVPRLCGAWAVHVIVPADWDFFPDDLPYDIGHNTFYFARGWRAVGKVGWVPLYSDVAELLRSY